jgi:murein DD-endopeptidase MepM/ murein hydrolase activator NlpD
MYRPLLAFLTIAFFAASCASDSAISTNGAGPNLESPAVEAPPPPPVIVTVSSPDNDRSIEPGVVEATMTVANIEEDFDDEAMVIQDGGVIEIEPASEQTATILPTYTAPASPEPSPRDHYWLRRPVPQGTAVWTDKAYPYGNTRGGTLRPHHGVEFNVPAGTEVMASADGTVFYAGEDAETQFGPVTNFYGNVIIIRQNFTQNNQAVFTLYGHLSEIIIEEGQEVKSGDVIAYSGSSGVADGAHLHFEVRVGDGSYDETRNPLLWLYPFPEDGVLAGTITWPDGSLAREVPINLRRLDAISPYLATTTYASDSVNPDLNWKENFVLDDISAGYYELSIGSGDSKEKMEIWIYPGKTNFVELVISQ